jgi:HSP20 family molecular chaperone IbpA
MKSLMPWKREDKHVAPIHWKNSHDRWWENQFKNGFSILKQSDMFNCPSIDVSEDKNTVTVKAEIPGMSEKNIELTWTSGVLNIRGEKKEEKEEKNKDHYYRECSYGGFTRAIVLGKNINWQKATAKYKHGVLTVTLPKLSTEQKIIEVKIN